MPLLGQEYPDGPGQETVLANPKDLKSGYGQLIEVEILTTIMGGGMFTLVIRGLMAALTLIDALSNTTVYRDSGQLDGSHTGTWVWLGK